MRDDGQGEIVRRAGAADPADADGHAAGGAAVEARLRAVGFGADHEGPGGQGRQDGGGCGRAEVPERPRGIAGRGGTAERGEDVREVAVENGDPVHGGRDGEVGA